MAGDTKFSTSSQRQFSKSCRCVSVWRGVPFAEILSAERIARVFAGMTVRSVCMASTRRPSWSGRFSRKCCGMVKRLLVKRR